jgi:hypothetical protein
MTHRRYRHVGLPVMAIFFLFSARGSAQITPRWFDINPSSSNDDRNGTSSGRVNHVGAASDLSKVYAATEWGGLYQSFDQGNTWVRINTFSPSATWDVKVNPQNSRQVYATSFFDGRVNPQSGISISNDAGNSWTPVSFARFNLLNCGSLNTAVPARRTQPSAWQIAINASDPQTVFVGTNCGLARTQDGGNTWTFIDPSPADGLAEQVYAVLVQGQTIDVITDNGHFRSPNNGGTWTALPSAPGFVTGNSGPGDTIAASPRESYVLLAASSSNIFESDDGGNTWPTSLNLPIRSNGNTNQQNRIPFIKTNQLSTSSQFDVWFADINVFKTTATTPSTLRPGGAPRTPINSWNNMQDGAHDDSGDVFFDPRARAGACPSFYSGDGGVFRNTNPNNPGCQGPSWSAPTITPHATWLWGFDGVRLSPGTHALTYGLQDDGGWAATNAAEGFNPPTPNWNNYTCCDILHNSEGAGKVLSLEGQYAPPHPFKLYIRNQDGGGGNEIPNYPSAQNFTRFESGKQNAPTGGNGYVVNVCATSSCAGSDVYATNNILAGGISWSRLASPTAGTTGTGSLKVAKLGGQPNVYYDTANGNPEVQGLIFRSTLVGARVAGGANWVQLVLPAGIGSVNTYDVDPTNGNHIIISGINSSSGNFEIWITPDFGATWQRLTNLENLMLGIGPAGGTGNFLNTVSQGKNTGTFNFGTYWQPSLFKFNPLGPNTIIAGAIDAGVFLSLDNGSNWQLISTPINPSSASPHIPRPLFAYFSPGRFNASTTTFDVWVGTRGAGVMKVVIQQPAQ